MHSFAPLDPLRSFVYTNVSDQRASDVSNAHECSYRFADERIASGDVQLYELPGGFPAPFSRYIYEATIRGILSSHPRSVRLSLLTYNSQLCQSCSTIKTMDIGSAVPADDSPTYDEQLTTRSCPPISCNADVASSLEELIRVIRQGRAVVPSCRRPARCRLISVQPERLGQTLIQRLNPCRII